MSHKGTQDKERDGYPFTARQRRRALGNRVTRKQARTKLTKIRAQRRAAPRRRT
jgi:hypothetical protein